MEFVLAIIVGAIIGVLGRLVLPGKQNIPLWLTVLVGIVAAFLGTLIASALGIGGADGDTNGIDWIWLAISVVLAAVGVSLVSGLYAGRGRDRV